MLFRSFFLTLLLLLFSAGAYAQDESDSVSGVDAVVEAVPESEDVYPEEIYFPPNDHHPDSVRWHKIVNDPHFVTYKDSVEYKVRKPIPPQPKKVKKFEDFILGIVEWLYKFFTNQYTLYTLSGFVVLALLYIVYRLIRGEGRLLAKNDVGVDGSGIINEDDLLTGNWEQKLSDAVRENDLRLAIRYSYVWLLQLLHSSENIKYKIDKTNNDYLREISDADSKKIFRNILRRYEFTWYGNFLPSKQEYDNYMADFYSLKSIITKY